MRVPSIDALPTPELREQARAALHPWRLPQTRSLKAQLRKYHNTPVMIDGMRFDSKLEWRCYTWLTARARSSERSRGLSGK